MKKLIYYILNYTFHHFEAKIIKILKNEKNLVVFDIGCFRGLFTKNILKLINRKKIFFAIRTFKPWTYT